MNNKKLKNQMIRHGEAILLPIDQLPSDAIVSKTVKKHIVSHSESGHHHVAVGDITLFEGFDISELRKQLSSFLYDNAEITGLFQVNKDSKLEHQKSFDTHETKPLSEGLYVVIIKQQYDYFTKALSRVRD